ncbi:ribosomal RNA-processing protein 7 homolog A-like [Ruditapes philippinarum]|uniref:ribosomal RNA-processing protein 7 homolog A-like n=2 Tax=Ruditapes philippinarum TaxID=129788 RepID=UPI00295BD394|nr:ribosomal RNA-processing protein 7 homolog A-like [Ruditapes philippinarum]
MASSSVVFQGFTVLPLKIEEKSTCHHYLYVKEHNIRDARDCKPKERTLFVLNVPPYCEEGHFREMFERYGTIQRIFFHSKPTSGPPTVNSSTFFPTAPVIQGYMVAYIVFKKVSSVKAITSLPYDKPLVMHKEGGQSIDTGLNKWIREYKEDVVDTAALQTEIDKYMTEYDEKIQTEIEKAKAAEGVPDEEGWVTVTKYGKNKGAPRTEAHEKALTRKEKKRRKDKELLNFYSFQMRETKREQIANLRKKFEEDKNRIALMKASRKFRPY